MTIIFSMIGGSLITLAAIGGYQEYKKMTGQIEQLQRDVRTLRHDN